MKEGMKIPKILWSFRATLIIIFTPLLILPLPLVVPGKAAACGYVIILMAIYWMTEVLPIAVTSFIPLVLFPIMGIMTASSVAMVYMKDSSWLFLGSFFIAIAVEHTELHKRIAVIVLQMVGTSSQCLMFGFMATSFFLSMWITNVASTTMMLPIVEAVLKALLPEKQNDNSENPDDVIIIVEENQNGTSFSAETGKKLDERENHSNQAFELEDVKADLADETHEVNKISTSKNEDIIQSREHTNFENLKKGFTLGVPYAASIGGIATLTGTPPNLLLAGQFEVLYPDAPPILSYGNWIAYNLPCALTVFLLAYVWMCWFFIGFEWGEITTSVLFILTVFLWFFRDPGFIPGWNVVFEDGYVSDGTVAMATSCLLFILPVVRPQFVTPNWRNSSRFGPVEPVLTWSIVNKKFPWGVLFLLGGGFAIAQGAEESGLSDWIAEGLSVLDQYSDWVICLIVTIITCLFTEIASNTATASIFIPILAQLSAALHVNPLYLLIPAVTSTSLAFMLPVATPPNAVAFAYGHLQVRDLVKAGFMVNIIGILTLNAFINTYGMTFWSLNEYPEWAVEINETATTLPECVWPITYTSTNFL